MNFRFLRRCPPQAAAHACPHYQHRHALLLLLVCSQAYVWSCSACTCLHQASVVVGLRACCGCFAHVGPCLQHDSDCCATPGIACTRAACCLAVCLLLMLWSMHVGRRLGWGQRLLLPHECAENMCERQCLVL